MDCFNRCKILKDVQTQLVISFIIHGRGIATRIMHLKLKFQNIFQGLQNSIRIYFDDHLKIIHSYSGLPDGPTCNQILQGFST